MSLKVQMCRGQSDSTVGRVLALHAVYQRLFPRTRVSPLQSRCAPQQIKQTNKQHGSQEQNKQTDLKYAQFPNSWVPVLLAYLIKLKYSLQFQFSSVFSIVTGFLLLLNAMKQNLGNYNISGNILLGQMFFCQAPLNNLQYFKLF